jgi:hypothetical protein
VSINNDASHYVYIPIYIIRLSFQPTMQVNIYKQCSGFHLTDGGYSSTGIDRSMYVN